MGRPGWFSGFLYGLSAGVVLCLALAAGTAYLVLRDGLTVDLDVEAIAAETRAEIELQVATLVPGILDDMKRQVPDRVAEQLAEKLGTASFSLYGVRIRLPEESLREIRNQIEAVVNHELAASLGTVDVAGSAAYWGRRGQDMIARSLQRELAGRTLLVRPLPYWTWLEVPVTLEVRGH